MSSNTFSKAGTFIIVLGFLLWAYGFFYGSFWFANTSASLLEPIRHWVSGYTGVSIKPGLMEEMLGLCIALLGMAFRVAGQYGKEG